MPVLREPLQEPPHVLDHPGRNRAVERLAVVLEPQHELGVGVADERDRVVRLALIREPAVDPRAARPPEQRVEQVVLEHHQRFEQRRAARHVAPRLNPRERGVLVFPEGQLLGPEGLEPPEHRLLRRYVRAERERIDEEADHVVGAFDRRLTARAGHAEEHVVLARVAAE